jgi:hypothetical protein
MDLPHQCDVGTKKNSKGYKDTWIEYKFHCDSAGRQIPVSCLLTSASTHDSQAALPLATLTSQRVINLYDLMDSAYDAPIIRDYGRALGHVPLSILTLTEYPTENRTKSRGTASELLHWENRKICAITNGHGGESKCSLER